MQLLFHNRFEDSAGSIAGIHPGGYFGRHLNKMRGIYKNKHDF